MEKDNIMVMRLRACLNREKSNPKTISQEEYFDLLGFSPKANKTNTEKALEYALQMRSFEIELYWKRATYFWTFIAATLAGYILILTTDSEQKEYLSVTVACLGFLFSFAWFFVNKGSKQWQENWENHVDLLEDSVLGSLYKIVTDRPKGECSIRINKFFLGPGHYSVSKINQIVSLFVTFLWGVLVFHALPDFNFEAEIDWNYVGLIAMTIIACLIIFCCGTTDKGDYKDLVAKLRKTTITSQGHPPGTLKRENGDLVSNNKQGNKMYYFAYGSNMSSRRIKGRIISVAKVGTGKLAKHKLTFHKKSIDGSAKCDAEYTDDANNIVYGVVYQLSEDQKTVLDSIEGLGHGYEEKTVSIEMENGDVLEAQIYYASDIDSSMKPFDWYKEHVVRGATENNLPEEYIQKISAADVLLDSNTKRREKELSIYRNLAKIVFSCKARQGLPPIFPQNLGSIHDDIENLELEYNPDPKKQELKITLTLVEGVSPSSEEAENLYNEMVIALVDHLAFELNCPLDSPSTDSYIDASGSATIFCKPANMNLSGGNVFIVVDPQSIFKRLATLPPTSLLLQEYNSVLHVSNPIQQFIALWGILTYIVGDARVTPIDNFLRSQGVPNEPIPGPHGEETKFARIRAQISHPSDREVKLSELPARVKKVLPEFRGIVRKAVAELLGVKINGMI